MALQRAKVAFIKGQDVVFKPKPTTNNETPDWVLGRVQQVLGEGSPVGIRSKMPIPTYHPSRGLNIAPVRAA